MSNVYATYEVIAMNIIASWCFRFVVVLSFLSLQVSAQTMQFYKTFSASRELSFLSIDTVHDGGLIIAGQEFSHDTRDYIYLKTDSNGIELWRRTNSVSLNSVDSLNRFLSVIETRNHDFLFCGELITLSPFKRHLLLLRTDSLGNEIWSKLVDDQYSIYGKEILELPNGDFVVFGQISSGTISDLFLKKYQANGDSVFTKTFNFGSNSAIPVSCTSFNNNLFLTGTILDSASFQHSWPCVIKIDTVGVLRNSIELNDTGLLSPINICVFQNQFINLPCSRGFTSGGSVSNLIRLDSTLNIVSNFDFFSMESCSFIDDSIFIGATAGISLFNGNIIADSLWNYLINEEFGNIWDVAFTRNRRTVACGRIDDGQSTTSIGLVLKLTSDLVNNTMEYDREQSQLCKLFPNPASQTLNIQIDSSLLNRNLQLSISIFDSNAILVKSIFNISESRSVINIDDLKTGVYTFRLNGTENLISGKFIIN